MQIQIQQFKITPFNIVKMDSEFKLGGLWVCMMAKVQVVLAPFQVFTSSYNASKAHNILALVFDPHFKSLDVVKTFNRHVKVIRMWLNMTTTFCCHCGWLLSFLKPHL
jgi:hypothetical protein